MKKVGLWIIAALFAFCIGIFVTKMAVAYIFYPTWRSDIDPCPYFSNIKNPLCSYSPDSNEVPTVTLSELVQNPALYDRKIIRVNGRFLSDKEDPHDSYFYMPDESGVEKPLGVSYWSWKVSEKLCKFIDVQAPDSNSADVTLVVQFLDVTNYPAVREANDGSPFVVMVLHVERMNAVVSPVPSAETLSKQPR
ncbi:MAG: hypothetical protein M3209_00840 [Acidobacteriota bacterium]|nr:hypothetical protein [Acidobacteriota bacterium]